MNIPIGTEKEDYKTREMIRMECQLEGVCKVKLLLGIKKKTGEMVQYCITVIEQQ